MKERGDLIHVSELEAAAIVQDFIDPRFGLADVLRQRFLVFLLSC